MSSFGMTAKSAGIVILLFAIVLFAICVYGFIKYGLKNDSAD
jgi:hypothetical protein